MSKPTSGAEAADSALTPLPPQDFTATDGLPKPREPVGHIKIVFSGNARNRDHPIHDISACVMAAGALFVAGDEACSIERLTPARDGTLANHRSYPLAGFLDLLDPEDEMDIEGLAVDDGWLWVTGSHSRTRRDPRDDGPEHGSIHLGRLADLKDTRPRCVLARIPLVEDGQGQPEPVRRDGKRHAGMVPRHDKHGSKLALKLTRDALLGPATRLAAKEGGLDIEGLAVEGDRIALGLRGPVIRTYAVILEPVIEPKKSGKLHVHGDVCKRLVDLNGLGIRDMRRRGSDLYILAGPTQDLNGRCAIFRWTDWVGEPPENGSNVQLHDPEHLFDLPVKFRHDHPEGIDFWTDDAGEPRLVVFYDNPNPQRLNADAGTILADLFALD